MERGGHIAEILDRKTGVNPLWIPPWTDEPSTDFGNNSESRLLDGIFGHNLCLDLFGPPSEAEAAAGVVAHGECALQTFQFEECEAGLIARCELPSSQLLFERTIRLQARRALIDETVENLSVFDRPIAWTQHVTLGPPFLEPGSTEFRVPATKSRAADHSYTAFLMDPDQSRSFFLAWSPTLEIACGYAWERSDFPWLGIWDEHYLRTHSPWNGRTLTRGMEFGVSPFPETRREMIERGTTFDTPCYRWIPARSRLQVRYCAGIAYSSQIPASFTVFETLC